MADKLVVVHLIGISPLHIEVVFLVMDGANTLEYVAVKRIEPLLLVTRQLSDALQQILRVDAIDNPARVCQRAIKSSEPCDVRFAVGSKVAIPFLRSPERAFFVAKSMVSPSQQNTFGECRCIVGRRGTRELRRTLSDEGCIEGGACRDDG